MVDAGSPLRKSALATSSVLRNTVSILKLLNFGFPGGYTVERQIMCAGVVDGQNVYVVDVVAVHRQMKISTWGGVHPHSRILLPQADMREPFRLSRSTQIVDLHKHIQCTHVTAHFICR